MASTAQSALEYVKSARGHLIRELTNLSVIVDNLYQLNVLSNEEVSKIQEEEDEYDKTRRILDSVTTKGEAACYELIKSIDMTRKRTSDEKKFDLHHWISCFSFNDDIQVDVNYLQGILKHNSDWKLATLLVSFAVLPQFQKSSQVPMNLSFMHNIP